MDKDLSKTLFRAAGVMTADWTMAPARDEVVEHSLGLPGQCEAVEAGIDRRAHRRAGARHLQAAITQAFQYDDEVMIERFVPGRELPSAYSATKHCLWAKSSPQHDVYDYECKYTAGMAREEFPAKLERARRHRCCRIRHLRAFRCAEAPRCAPHRLPIGRRRHSVLSRGEHASGADRHESHSAGSGSSRDGLRRAV